MPQLRQRVGPHARPLRPIGRQKHSERRRERRYGGPLLLCTVLAPAGLAGAVVVDLSARGARLALPLPVEAGDLLHLHLSNAQHLCARVVALRVGRCTGQASGPWFVAGPFDVPLPPEALHALLG